MTTAVTVEHFGEYQETLFYKVKNSILSDDFELLAKNIKENFNKSEVDNIVLDISEADSIRFKPTRLFVFYEWLIKRVLAEGKSITLKIVVNKEQYEIYDLKNSYPTFDIEMKNIEQKDNNVTGSERLYRLFIQRLSFWIIPKKLRFFVFQPNQLINCFVIPLFLLSSFFFIACFFFFTNTLIGNVILITSGVLLIESFIIIRLFNKHKG